MGKICYKPKQFRRKNRIIIDVINIFISESKKKKNRITVKRIHDHLSEKGFFENTRRGYKNVCQLIAEARLAGLIDWNIIDGRRQLKAGEK